MCTEAWLIVGKTGFYFCGNTVVSTLPDIIIITTKRIAFYSYVPFRVPKSLYTCIPEYKKHEIIKIIKEESLGGWKIVNHGALSRNLRRNPPTQDP